MTPQPTQAYPLDLHGWFRWQEPFAQLLSKHRPTACVEVGSWMGCSAVFTAQRIKTWGGHLTCVDLWGPWYLEDHAVAERSATAYERFCSNIHYLGLSETVTPLRMTSPEAARGHGPVDWVYIDGSHDYPNVKADLDAWWPLLREGGLFLGDDFGMLGPRMAWTEWATTHGRSLSDIEGQLVWVVK